MTDDAIPAIEYEMMILGRHLAGMPGRSRRTGGILDHSSYVLLSILQAGGPMSIGELGSVTRLDASTLNRQTAVLVREGLADRIADPAGGIARKFEINDIGVRLLNDERMASRQGVENITEDWSDEERAHFAVLLRRVNSAVESRLGREWPRPSKERPQSGREAETR